MKTKISWLLLVGLSVAVVTGVHSQTTSPKYSASKTDQYKVFQGLETPWKGDNTPYHNSRTEIDGLIAKGEKPLALAAQYRGVALKDKYNPVAQFRWAYAARKAALASKPFDVNKLIESYHALEVVHRANKPHAYDFSRLIFLSGVDYLAYPQKQELKDVGRRLVERDPKDIGVRYQWVRILNSSMSVEDRREGIRQAQIVLKTEPTKANFAWLLASSYDGLWSLTKKRSDANTTIAAYRKLLTPQTSQEDRKYVVRQIELIDYF